MRFIVLGTSLFTKICALGLMEAGANVVAIITMPAEVLPNNSISLKDFCNEKKIMYGEFLDINSNESLNFILKLEPDYIFSTWPKILGKKIIHAAKKISIGSHPTQLPMFRGRHPLHWLICLGVQNTALTLFVLDEKIDNGPILMQRFFATGENINIANTNMAIAAKSLFRDFLLMLKHNQDFRGFPQALESSNYLRKKDQFDVTIDPRMSYSMICRIVNSFCHPYPGAILRISRQESIRISSVSCHDAGEIPSNWRNFEHGYVFFHNHNSISMRADDAVVLINIYPPGLRLDCKPGSKIRPPEYYASYCDDV